MVLLCKLHLRTDLAASLTEQVQRSAVQLIFRGLSQLDEFLLLLTWPLLACFLEFCNLSQDLVVYVNQETLSIRQLPYFYFLDVVSEQTHESQTKLHEFLHLQLHLSMVVSLPKEVKHLSYSVCLLHFHKLAQNHQ